jgi:acyl-CoA reductase-like NAD-dependent aldehyde dehydrogenase
MPERPNAKNAMSIPHIPVLRQGKPYESLDRVELKSVRTGEPVAQISQANAALIRRDARRQAEAHAALRELSIDQLIAISERAGEIFMSGTVPIGAGTQSPEQYIECISATTGLPHSLVRRNMAKIHQVFTQMRTILRGLTRGLDPQVINDGFGEQSGVPVSYFATTHVLGVVLPSNSPGVNSLWMPAVAMRVPVILKPGREEPWTPFRIIQSFIAAGVPADAFSFYPTDHEGSSTVMDVSGRALIFGDVGTVQRYAGNPGVSVHGPGWSKVLIGKDVIDRWPEYLDLIAQSIAENGGRSCVNASAVLVPSHAEELGEALARKLADIHPVSYLDERATLAGFANPKMAEFIDAAIEQDLAGAEFLFPYASLTEIPQEKMLETIGPSLVVTVITEDPAFIEAAIASPTIDRLNIGPLPTTRVQWDQPHEGNLFEFLYRRRAIQRA